LSPGWLKSCLQKAVRRGRVDAAGRLLSELWAADASEAVRRTAVIILEDGALHPAYPLIAWLLLAMPAGFEPPPPARGAVLHVMREVAGAPWADVAATGGGSGAAAAHSSNTLAVCDALPPAPRYCVRSLLARAAFGGMACDVAMLRAAAGVWASRFAASDGAGWAAVIGLKGTDASACVYRVPVAATTLGVPPLTLDAVPAAGIDFHCSAILDELLAASGSTLTPRVAAALAAIRSEAPAGTDLRAALSTAMWHFRSGVNVRAPMPRSLPFPPPRPVATTEAAVIAAAVAAALAAGTARDATPAAAALAAVARQWDVLASHFDAWSADALAARW